MKNQIMIIMLSAAFFATNSAFGMMKDDGHEEQASAAPSSLQNRDEVLKKIKKIKRLTTQAQNAAIDELYNKTLKK